MIKTKITHNSTIPLLWFFGLLTIYILFLIFGLFSPNSPLITTLKISSIALCLLYTIIYFRQDRLLVLAFSFTLLADIILTINQTSNLGVFIFCFAQFTHFLRLINLKIANKYLLVLLLLPLALGFLFPENIRTPLFGVFYAFFLITNLILSISWFKKSSSTRARFATIGFILFICCDLCVVFSYAANISLLPLEFAIVADYFAWFFYLPSQFCLAQSTKL